MPAHKLLLHPKDASFRVPVKVLAERLQDLGLIGTATPLPGGEFYPAGEYFLQLVTFLGCAPTIELAPPRDPAQLETASRNGAFCHVFLDSHAQAQFRHDPRTPAPRCPHCGESVANWTALLNTIHENPAQTQWTCTACGRCGDLSTLHLRKSAALASCWVEIRGIYPSEAVPGEALLTRLRQLSGCNWLTIYLKE
jgi:hypothetical protein